MTIIKNITFLFLSLIALASCNHDFSWLDVHDKPRAEYAPNMYYSEAYEPLKQITDSAKYGNEYNSNPYNPHRMNMRMPAAGTIPRNAGSPFIYDASKIVYLPYTISKDSLDYAAATVKSPIGNSETIVKEGQVLYGKYCLHCHGETGQGDGEVGKKLGGVPKYNEQRLKNISEGHIFHVITHGKGRMGAHASQISQENRWKIAAYVQTLQKQASE